MDRIQEYPGQTPIPVEDFLNQRVADMIALGELVESLFGSSTVVDGLDCTPTSPASMNVNVARGRIYMSAPIDTTDFGDLSPTVAVNGRSAIPNATNIMKQGLLLSPSTFALTAPATAGYSVNYLIQATFEEVDDQNNVLNYFTSLTSPPLSGPNGNGTSQPQLRKGMCVLELKQGAAAATGTQQTPAVDSGYVGLWVITVASGAVSVVAANISQYPEAPFLALKLAGLMTGSTPSLVPTGAVMPFAGSSAPTGWLLCQGQAVSRTAYAVLFSLIGTTYGAGDGSTTFNLPNLQGKVPFGVNSSDSNFSSLGEAGGAEEITLSVDNLPVGTIGTIPFQPNGGGNFSSGGGGGVYTGDLVVGGTTNVTSDGSSAPIPSLPPYLVLNYMIKY